MKKIRSIHILLCLLISTLFLFPALVDIPLPLVQELGLKSIDIRFKIRGGRNPSGNIVIAGIESKGFDRYGRWPWPRSVLAKLLIRLKESGAKTVVFDLLLSEPEENRAVQAIRTLTKTYRDLNLLKDDFNSQIFSDEMDQLIEELDNDTLLAQSVEWSGNVILPMAFDPQKELKGPVTISEKALYQSDLKESTVDSRIPFFEQKHIVMPINKFKKVAAAIGFVNIFPDRDGTIRKIPSTILSQHHLFMPLAVAASSLYLEATPFWDPNGTLSVGDRKIEFTPSGDIYLDFYGLENPFASFSIVDIIEGVIPPDQFNGKLVIVGSMATGIGDIWPTPLSSGMPGVLIQATLLDNILQNMVLKTPKHQTCIYVFSILLMAAMPILFMIFFPPLIFTLAGFSVLFGYGAVIQYLFTVHQLIWPATLPLGAGFLSILTLLVYNFMVEVRQHLWIKRSFSQYLSPDIIDLLVKEPERLSLGGEKQIITVMMVDIRNFTSLSEEIPPEKLIQILNIYLGELTEVILEHGGTVDKYMGDAIMAFFGAPIHDPQNGTKACQTAIMMFERLHEKRVEWSSKGVPSLWLGMGINTGPMVVGNLGCAKRFDYSVIGDHVNLASRLEGISKVYGVKIVISEYTRNALGPEFKCRELDNVRVKGRQQAVRIYELLGKDYFTDGLYAFVDSFERGLACYREGSFIRAIDFFKETLSLKPDDKPSQLFIHRCYTLEKEELQTSWDGTCIFDQK